MPGSRSSPIEIATHGGRSDLPDAILSPMKSGTVKIFTSTLDRVLTEAEALPQDEQAMLEELLRGRRIEAWRRDTAAESKKAMRAFRAGKLKPQPVESLLAGLRAAK